MNKIFIFLLISTVIVVFSVISFGSAPIINKTIPSSSEWAYGNCQYEADQEEKATDLNDQYSHHRKKTLCQRKKAMYGLEYASLIFDVIFGFVCTLLSFLKYLKIGKGTEKKTGLVGLITGVVGFVLTFLYFVYSAYIFTKDTPDSDDISGNNERLFPNGASKKNDGTVTGTGVPGSFITPYANDKSDDSEFIKYYELGQKQYNYDSDYSRVYSSSNDCKTGDSNSCDFLYEISPYTTYANKYLYDKWTNTLIFTFVISVCNIGLIIFGLLLFLGGDKEN